MSFLIRFWPHILILASLLIVIVVFLRRMPKEVREETLPMKPKKQASPDKEKMTTKILIKVKEGYEAIKGVLHKLGDKLRDRIMRKKHKEDVSAVSSMFETQEAADKVAQPKVGASTSTTMSKMAAGTAAVAASVRKQIGKNDSAENRQKVDELLRRAKMYLKEDRSKDAEKTFIDAIQLSPRDERIYYELGLMYMNQNNYKDSRASLQEVVKLKKDHIDAYSKLGLVAYRDKKFDEAARHYEDALKLDTDNPKHKANQALALKAAGNSKKAFKLYSEAFEAKKSETDYGVHALELALELKKPKKAEPILVELEKNTPENDRVQELRKEYDGMVKK